MAKITLSYVLIFLFCAKSIQADGVKPETPTAQQVRAHYQEVSSLWPTIPRAILLAFVAAEDRHFFDKPSEFSTITRQITRWYPDRRASKLQKFASSLVIGKELSHDEILNWYANQIFLGQSCFGVSGAAVAYFGKPVTDLKLEEITYLAALPKSPARFHPHRSYARAIERRNHVLSAMLEARFISREDAGKASQENLETLDPLETCERRK